MLVDDNIETVLAAVVMLQGEVDTTDKYDKEEDALFKLREMAEKLIPKLQELCKEAGKMI